MVSSPQGMQGRMCEGEMKGVTAKFQSRRKICKKERERESESEGSVLEKRDMRIKERAQARQREREGGG